VINTFKGGGNMMTQNEIKKIEEKIYKDGSLTEEKKTELLNLLATMNPELVESSGSQVGYAQKTVGLNEHPTTTATRRKKTGLHF
jgi:hypothetical protein